MENGKDKKYFLNISPPFPFSIRFFYFYQQVIVPQGFPPSKIWNSKFEFTRFRVMKFSNSGNYINTDFDHVKINSDFNMAGRELLRYVNFNSL